MQEARRETAPQDNKPGVWILFQVEEKATTEFRQESQTIKFSFKKDYLGFLMQMAQLSAYVSDSRHMQKTFQNTRL